MVTFTRHNGATIKFRRLPKIDEDPASMTDEMRSAHMLAYPHLYSGGGDTPFEPGEVRRLVMEDDIDRLVAEKVAEALSK